jgi:MoaA/NifB/PqqE/SkfB family radical SAM enzyme
MFQNNESKLSNSFDLSGLASVNIELTNRCNKECWMCGRRKIDRYYPEIALHYGDMDFELLRSIAKQMPKNIVVQFHNNGEGLLYPRFGEAVNLFKNQIKCLTSNGLLLTEKADEIIDNLDSITISVIQNEIPELKEKLINIIKCFLQKKGKRKPYVVFRLLGNVDDREYRQLDGLIVRRTLHNPLGSFQYKRETTKPEIGVCLDFLHHMSINRQGLVSICVRFDPTGLGVIGDATKETLSKIWNNPKRMEWLNFHLQGRRNMAPLCKTCEFWGIPTSPNENHNL